MLKNMEKNMDINIIVDAPCDEYEDQYVAIPSISSHYIISHGIEPMSVIKEAKIKGCSNPIIVYIPKKNMVNFY